jgi:hypothetical protein
LISINKLAYEISKPAREWKIDCIYVPLGGGRPPKR